jgi:hypothetical protein
VSRGKLLSIVAVALMLVGCGTTSIDPPAGFSLDGTWEFVTNCNGVVSPVDCIIISNGQVTAWLLDCTTPIQLAVPLGGGATNNPATYSAENGVRISATLGQLLVNSIDYWIWDAQVGADGVIRGDVVVVSCTSGSPCEEVDCTFTMTRR